MGKVLAWLQTDQGKRMTALVVSIITLVMQGGVLPLDAPIPWLNVSLNQLMTQVAIVVASRTGTTSQSPTVRLK